MSHRIPEDIGAVELRKEADRRELVERAKRMYERRVRRNALIDQLLDIPLADVYESGANAAMRELFIGIAASEITDRDMHPTHGDINLLGPRSWWEDWKIEEVKPHWAIYEIEKRRMMEFRSLVEEKERRVRHETIEIKKDG